MSAASGGAAAIAAAAAAEAQRLMQEEEEEMTPYSPRDLAEDWEFKILRSNMSAFRNPARLRAILDEESRGGWVLVEKFDDCRIRLKRPVGAKVMIEDDLASSYDPYRTNVGAGQATIVWIALACGFLCLIFIFGVIALTH
jgi:hypothetical protein